MTSTAVAAPPVPVALPSHSERARAWAVEVARIASDSRCHQVRVLDVSGLSPVTEYMVLASGTSARQMRSAAEEASEIGKTKGYAPFGTNGLEGEVWMLVDFVHVVMHVFSTTSRDYFDLDNLWGDAREVDWEREEAATAAR